MRNGQNGKKKWGEQKHLKKDGIVVIASRAFHVTVTTRVRQRWVLRHLDVDVRQRAAEQKVNHELRRQK